MHANTHIDAPIVGQPVVALRHLPLKHCRALDRIVDAPKFGQQAITYQLENAPAMVRDLRLEQLLPMRPQAVERVGLVLDRKALVAYHIVGEAGGELAVHREGLRLTGHEGREHSAIRLAVSSLLLLPHEEKELSRLTYHGPHLGGTMYHFASTTGPADRR